MFSPNGSPPLPPSAPARADVPVGGEDVSVQLALVGQRRSFDFPTKDHLQLGEELDLIDFETGGVVRCLACSYHWMVVAKKCCSVAWEGPDRF